MCGRLWATSEGHEKGSRFYFEFPLKEVLGITDAPETAGDEESDLNEPFAAPAPEASGDDSIDNNNDGLADCKYPPAYADIIAEWKCGNGNDQKVLVCHNEKTKCYDYISLADHIAHGDYLGPCGSASCGNARGEGAQDRAAATATIFPNPASGETWLNLHDYEGQTCLVRLMDVRGVLIKEINVAEASHEPLRLDLGGLATGLYFVHLQPESEVAKVVKLMVENQK